MRSTTLTSSRRKTRSYAPRMNKQERHEQLLDAALQVVVEQGVHKVSMDSVAHQANVSRPVVYSIFANTDELLRASLHREESRIRTQLTDILTRLWSGEYTGLRAALAAFLTAVRQRPDSWRTALMVADSSTPAVRKRLAQGRQELLNMMEQILQAGDNAANIDIPLTARTIYALFWEAGRLSLDEPETFDQERILKHADYMIENARTRRKPPPAGKGPPATT